jgi:hypothetical protein
VQALAVVLSTVVVLVIAGCTPAVAVAAVAAGTVIAAGPRTDRAS